MSAPYGYIEQLVIFFMTIQLNVFFSDKGILQNTSRVW